MKPSLYQILFKLLILLTFSPFAQAQPQATPLVEQNLTQLHLNPQWHRGFRNEVAIPKITYLAQNKILFVQFDTTSGCDQVYIQDLNHPELKQVRVTTSCHRGRGFKLDAVWGAFYENFSYQNVNGLVPPASPPSWSIVYAKETGNHHPGQACLEGCHLYMKLIGPSLNADDLEANRDQFDEIQLTNPLLPAYDRKPAVVLNQVETVSQSILYVRHNDPRANGHDMIYHGDMSQNTIVTPLIEKNLTYRHSGHCDNQPAYNFDNPIVVESFESILFNIIKSPQDTQIGSVSLLENEFEPNKPLYACGNTSTFREMTTSPGKKGPPQVLPFLLADNDFLSIEDPNDVTPELYMGSFQKAVAYHIENEGRYHLGTTTFTIELDPTTLQWSLAFLKGPEQTIPFSRLANRRRPVFIPYSDTAWYDQEDELIWVNNAESAPIWLAYESRTLNDNWKIDAARISIPNIYKPYQATQIEKEYQWTSPCSIDDRGIDFSTVGFGTANPSFPQAIYGQTNQSSSAQLIHLSNLGATNTAGEICLDLELNCPTTLDENGICLEPEEEPSLSPADLQALCTQGLQQIGNISVSDLNQSVSQPIAATSTNNQPIEFESGYQIYISNTQVAVGFQDANNNITINAICGKGDWYSASGGSGCSLNPQASNLAPLFSCYTLMLMLIYRLRRNLNSTSSKS